MARTDTLGNFLTDVADAIRTKAGTSEPIQASSFDTAIANIPSGGGADLSEYFVTEITENTTQQTAIQPIKKCPTIIVSNTVTSLTFAFGWHNITVPSLKVLFPNSVTTTEQMFYVAYGMDEIDLTGSNAENVTNMRHMFGMITNAYAYDNDRLTTIIFGSDFNTKKVTRMDNMFAYRHSLTTLDLSMFETPALTRTGDMFTKCTALRHIDMRNFDFSGVTTYYGNTFGNNASNGVPNDCEIIVKDQTQKDWVTSKFSRLTNVKTVEEYEAE